MSGRIFISASFLVRITRYLNRAALSLLSLKVVRVDEQSLLKSRPQRHLWILRTLSGIDINNNNPTSYPY